ncbi:MAG TPA: DNA-binding protein [Acidimicrobiia bacterium]|nr:DNA-binding protein [Acidimicrobiia bacterium]
MGLRKRLRRLTAPVEELERDRLQARFGGHDVTRCGDVEPRTRVAVVGEIQATKVVPRAGSPSLEVTVDDGTGQVVAVFTGRKRLGGVGPGRGVVVDGVPRDERGRLVMLNPAYRLLP